MIVNLAYKQVFITQDIYKAHKAWDVLEVGGVIIGDVPSWRVDHMPYGGVKRQRFRQRRY